MGQLSDEKTLDDTSFKGHLQDIFLCTDRMLPETLCPKFKCNKFINKKVIDTFKLIFITLKIFKD